MPFRITGKRVSASASVSARAARAATGISTLSRSAGPAGSSAAGSRSAASGAAVSGLVLGALSRAARCRTALGCAAGRVATLAKPTRGTARKGIAASACATGIAINARLRGRRSGGRRSERGIPAGIGAAGRRTADGARPAPTGATVCGRAS